MNLGDKIITFESYYDLMLAQIILTKLKANGVSCFIADENILWAKPYFNQLLGGVKIRIFEKDLNRCSEILTTENDLYEQDYLKIEGKADNTTECPYCASGNVRYGGATEFRFHLPSLLFSMFFLIPMYFRNSWHCFNCHREFE